MRQCLVPAVSLAEPWLHTADAQERLLRSKREGTRGRGELPGHQDAPEEDRASHGRAGARTCQLNPEPLIRCLPPCPYLGNGLS